MNRFIKNCLVITLGIIMVLFLLDILYTKVYENAFPRNKTQHILNLKPGTEFDYVFLGSSRTENFIMPSIIKSETKKEALNLGTQGARLGDMNLFLRLLIDKKVKIKRLFVQVDYIYNFESSSDIVHSQALPYIRSNTIIKNYMNRVDSSYFKNYYIPFYRYASNDYRLGFREFFASSINKKSKTDFSNGFVPLFNSINQGEKHTASLPNTILEKNKSLIEIDALCTANNIKVTYFCAPFCSGLVANNYLSKLKEKIPDFKDFSTVIKEDSLFQNCSHLNKNGAEAFTRHLITALNL
ncbi:hypothetical protein [Lacinutrix venerupis]|uniref:DUF1574 domain-containing protein n=1 Tax=Lacinutrix venerupis TaxID=1486034 RepID=A0AAC9LPU1_9FLAO|nr:hypothetical protein [Lacinutrix venerupis]APY00722.1 hypothetical protein BWR22_10495 [Lacinutrix venerupis]